MKPAATTEAALDALLAGARVLEPGAPRPKVARLADGDILKAFRPRRGIAAPLRRSRAADFMRSARTLCERGFAAPAPTTWLRDPAGIEYLRYPPLAGTDLRHLPPDARAARASVALMLRLHDAGVLFRALHLRNILAGADGSLALIDVADARFRSRALGPGARARNFVHFLRYPEDRAWFEAAGVDPRTEYLARIADRPRLAAAVRRRLTG